MIEEEPEVDTKVQTVELESQNSKGYVNSDDHGSTRFTPSMDKNVLVHFKNPLIQPP